MEHRHCGGHHGHASGEDQKEFFNKLADEWDVITVHNEDRVRYIVSLLKLKGTEKILDVGTGTGVMIPFYEEHLTSGSVHAMDFSEKMIARCNEKFPAFGHPNVTFGVADVYDMKYRDEFDIVMCYSCFPHFSDHQRAVDILAGALRPGGRLAIAHATSRDRVNNVHSQSSRHIQNDVLPCLNELGSMFGKAGLSAVFRQSDDEYHIIIGEKV